MTSIRIIGAGGHGKVVADVAAAVGYTDIAFLDRCFPERTVHGSWKICGTPSWSGSARRFCAVGSNAVRARLFDQSSLGDSPVLIHPFSSVSPSAHLEPGTLLVAGAVVNADVNIGRGTILNTGCSIDHDCIIGDFAHISPGARLAGNVQIGARTWIGIGAVVREGVKIGSDVTIAAGAAVIHDIADNMIVGGVPAVPLEQRN